MGFIEKFRNLKPNRKSLVIISFLYVLCFALASIPWIMLAFRELQWDDTAMTLRSIGVIAVGVAILVPMCLYSLIRKRCDAYYENHLPPEEIERRQRMAEEFEKKREYWAKRCADYNVKEAESRKKEMESKSDSERIYELEKKIQLLTENESKQTLLLKRLVDLPYGFAFVVLVVMAIVSCNNLNDIKELKDQIESIGKSQKNMEYDIDAIRRTVNDIDYDLESMKRNP